MLRVGTEESQIIVDPRPHIRDVYRVPERMDERQSLIRLDRNERVSDLPASFFHSVVASLEPEDVSTYPDPSPIYDRLTQGLGLPTDCLYVTSGSDAAIRMILQAYAGPGERLVIPDPTYAMYAVYAEILELQVQQIVYGPDVRLEVEAIVDALRDGPRVLALPNPGQPTGTALPREDLLHIIERAGEVGTLTIIDEAYFPCHNESVMDLVPHSDHLLVTRSFSKVAGLAGLRLGYVAGHPDLVDGVQRVRGLHEVNALAVKFGTAVLDHPEIVDAYVCEVEAGRDILREAAGRMSLGFPDCVTNFQLLRFSETNHADQAMEKLKQEGFLVRGGFGGPALSGCIRVTLGPADLMRSFIEALERVVEGMG